MFNLPTPCSLLGCRFFFARWSNTLLSLPEKQFFFQMLRNNHVKKDWFTGMLTHGQSDFVIPYIDPESNTLRKYYPDFLIKWDDGIYEIVEIKADFQVEDAVVKAKQAYAEQLATASEMTYRMVKATEVRLRAKAEPGQNYDD